MNQMMSWCPGPPGCPPPGNPWGGLEQCWNDVNALEALLTKIITDMLAKDPNVFGQLGNIKGVTDGSIAPPGAVGEIVGFSGSASYSANAVASVTLTTMGTLPAGDWDIQAWVTFSTGIDAFQLDNVPTTTLGLPEDQQIALIPAGMSWIGVQLAVASTGTTETTEQVNVGTIVGYYRGAGPVQVILRTVIDSGNAAGTAVIGFLARRMR